jgi:hypothetical protein
MPIAVANTHALRDPAFAEAEVTKHFSSWLDAGEDVLAYGANLFLRSIRSRHDSVEDLVVIGSVFRQVLVAADGCLVCLRAGAVQQAMLHSRAEFEASMALQWILAKGKEHWARQFYVSTLRQTRMWARQIIPGTAEHAANAAAWKGVQNPPGHTQDQIQHATTDVAAIDALLNSPPYKQIEDSFENKSLVGKGAKRRRIEPHWYEPGGVPSIGAMARDLGREAEYSSIYRYQSYFVHGSLAENHFKVRAGQATIEPIRYLKQFATAFNGTFVDVVRTYEWITAEYRAGELADLRTRYQTQWRDALMRFAEVTVTPEIISF